MNCFCLTRIARDKRGRDGRMEEEAVEEEVVKEEEEVQKEALAEVDEEEAVEEVEEEQEVEIEEVEEVVQEDELVLDDEDVEETKEEKEDNNFVRYLLTFKTELEILYFIKKSIYHPEIISFLPVDLYEDGTDAHGLLKENLNRIEIFIATIPSKVQHADDRPKLVDIILNLAYRVKELTNNTRKRGYYKGDIDPSLSRAHSEGHITKYYDLSYSRSYSGGAIKVYDNKHYGPIYSVTYSERDIMRENWKKFLVFVKTAVSSFEKLEETGQKKMQLVHTVIGTITNSPDYIKELEMSFDDRYRIKPWLLEKAVLEPKDKMPITKELEPRETMSITEKLEPREILLIKAFTSLVGLKESSGMVNFLLEIFDQLESLAHNICLECYNRLSDVLLIGGLLSFKQPDYRTWERVLDDIRNTKARISMRGDLSVPYIFKYCCEDLSGPLRKCFDYVKFYPIDEDIPAMFITKIWIAEQFITPETGVTREETANKYLEQLLERSMIWVSKRSFSGTIKYFRVPRSFHEFVIRNSCFDEYSVVNPQVTDISDMERVAIQKDNNNQYKEVISSRMCSFLGFDIDRNIFKHVRYLRVLELRNSVVPQTLLEKVWFLRYLGLRGSKISELPKNIGNMKDLQTLDVRDTNIEILPESLWNILGLRHIYVDHGPRIQGPPATANLPNLQTLKTVGVHESWQENVPNLSINLIELAFSYVGHLELETISNPLSRMVNLLSIAIKGPIINAELADTRALPNLHTLKSIMFVGKWKFRKLSIDNVEFPSNLVKLTLIDSSLKEDPMPRLERLKALKSLRLLNGAYTGEKMVCSANGFPQLQILLLRKLENLEIWEVNLMAMPQLTTLHVVQCQKLNNLPDFEHVEDKVIDN